MGFKHCMISVWSHHLPPIKITINYMLKDVLVLLKNMKAGLLHHASGCRLHPKMLGIFFDSIEGIFYPGGVAIHV